MKELYLFYGLPFSGKTTLARTLCKSTGYTLISWDEIRKQEEELFNFLQKEDKSVRWEHTRRVGLLRVDHALARGKSVIYDAVNPTLQYRTALRETATKRKATPVLIYMNTSLDVVESRIQANRITPHRPDIQNENFAIILDSFEPPLPDEHPIEFNSTDTIDDWLKEFKNKKQSIQQQIFPS